MVKVVLELPIFALFQGTLLTDSVSENQKQEKFTGGTQMQQIVIILCFADGCTISS